MASQIVLFTNKQKKHHENWYAGRDLLNLPCPSRIVMAGKPNSGKTSIILNMILKAQPHYERIFLMHPALKSNETSDSDDEDDDDVVDEVPEYDHIDYEPLYEFPHPKFFDNGCKKQLLVIDDTELRTMKKEQKKRLNKVVSYSSSHYNLSIIVSSQDIYSQIPPCILRFANAVILWRFSDLRYMRMLLDNVGINKNHKEAIINEMDNYGLHDYLMVDNTLDTPARYRKNGYVKVLTNI
jgi:hypothetical protein